MTRLPPYVLSGLLMFGGLACGEDDAPITVPGTNGDMNGDDNGTMNGDDNGTMNGDDNGSMNGDMSGGLECADDDAATPGLECAGVVSCGDDLGCAVCCMKGFADEMQCADGAGACPDDFLPTPCDGPEDCGDGEECCAGQATAGTCGEIGSCGVVGCHTDDDCPAGETCEPGGTLTWWGFCG